jgi:DNA-binding MarR family transcriptional regulator
MYSEANSFSREVSRHFDSFFEVKGLTTSYVELLLILSESDEVSQKDIAEKMNLAPSTITRFIGKLEKAGYIKKSRDGKTMSISLANRKKKDVEALKRLYEKAELDLQKKLGEKFIETTTKLLEYGTEGMQD